MRQPIPSWARLEKGSHDRHHGAGHDHDPHRDIGAGHDHCRSHCHRDVGAGHGHDPHRDVGAGHGNDHRRSHCRRDNRHIFEYVARSGDDLE